MPAAWACAYGEDACGLWQAFEVAGVRQVLRWIPPGSFLMGSPEDEALRGNNERQRRMVLEQGYWMADTACTQALWEVVCGSNRSRFLDPENPAEQVSWSQITNDFLPALKRLLPGLQARLPTEVEWEHACRAGTPTPFWFGLQLSTAQANFDGNHPYPGGEQGEFRKCTVPVKALPANGWGLYQMHGNVWEWCQDVYVKDTEAATPLPGRDAAGADRRAGGSSGMGELRVLRGGGWIDNGRDCRSANRIAVLEKIEYDDFGFRFVVDP